MAINLKNDIKLSIATGRSRTTKQWKNKELTWSAFLEKLSTATRTRETVAEYRSFPKADQDSIKDVGGFVGAYLAGGRRTAGSVKQRYVVTLDADFASESFTSLLNVYLCDWAYAYYTTHKHTPEAPRFRVLLPLSRPVTPEEYQPLARKIASLIGIDYFDDTTYEAERLMYWPSASADGEYLFNYNDAPILDPGKMLGMYVDWKDSTSWPESSRATGIRIAAVKQQGDPLIKPGLIGAFCRTYDIDGAIAKYLPDAYHKCDAPNRYTYALGSTAAGLVVYAGKFAYSHHGTDPTGGKLCNSFDLVRLHLFGDMDTDLDLPVDKLPSYIRMLDLAQRDPAVLDEFDKDRGLAAQEEFKEGDTSWKNNLHRNKGVIVSDPVNLKLILMNDERLKGIAGYNEFNYYTEVLKDLPWRKADESKLWIDRDDACLRNYLFEQYQVKGKDLIFDATQDVFLRNRFHPVREFILSKPWDGAQRAETIWIDYLGADDTEYVRAVSRKHLLAAVARVFEPGVKFDNILVLTGPQGIGKSTMLKKLGQRWFSDSFFSVTGKEAYEQLLGNWIIEVGELYATKKADTEATKQFLSKSEDVYRAAYGRRVMGYPRQCVFYGSTNETVFLRDQTGNRRFWPVEVRGQGSKSFTALGSDTAQQIWAEAYTWYQNKETLYLTKEMEAEAAKAQEDHGEESELKGLIEEYLEKKLPPDWKKWDLMRRRNYFVDDNELMANGTEDRTLVCALEVWCEALGRDASALTGMQSRNINNILRKMPGWVQRNGISFGCIYGRQRGFKRKNKAAIDDLLS